MVARVQKEHLQTTAGFVGEGKGLFQLSFSNC